MSHSFKADSKDRFQKQAENYPLFSFKYYLKDHGRYGFSFFSDNLREKIGAYEGFCELLSDLSSEKMASLLQRRKNSGLETIPVKHFSSSFQQALNSSGLSFVGSESRKLTVFRFKSKYQSRAYRMICFPDLMDGRIYYVVGFDFDYKAYKH